MRLLKNFLLIGLFMFTNCASTNSQSSSDWNLLGEKKVDYAPDRDVIIVNSNPKYNKIKVKVLNGRVLIQDMKVEFGDGDIMDVSLKYAFDEGGYSRDIELPRGNRHIKKIFFRYRTSKNSFEKGIVQVWGSK